MYLQFKLRPLKKHNDNIRILLKFILRIIKKVIFIVIMLLSKSKSQIWKAN